MKKLFFKIFIFLFVLSLLNISPSLLQAAGTNCYRFETGIPLIAKQGDCLPPTSIQNFLVSFINKMLFPLAGILGFAMIIYAGFEYTISGGDSNKQKDAQQRITSALIGLILLFAFYIILYTINPDILKTEVPSLAPVNLPSVSTPFNPTPSDTLTNLEGFSHFCPKTGTPPLIPYNPYDVLDEPSNCFYLKNNIYEKLIALYKEFPDWELTEACQRLNQGQYPCWTTYKHDSLCHQTGDCVDIVLNSYSLDNEKKFIAAANKNGLDVYNEYKNECKTEKTTGGHFHVVIHGFKQCINTSCWSCAQ